MDAIYTDSCDDDYEPDTTLSDDDSEIEQTDQR